jgi:NAD(P)-dependent dehydrogenase (short-subunit alcohol dehydrogenase family)
MPVISTLSGPPSRIIENMIADQRPLGSGFDASSTAVDVLDGLDLTGKLAVVTGGYSGLGLAATQALTDAGVHVVVPARRPDTARRTLSGVNHVEVDELDLGDLESARRFAERFLDSGRTIDMMIDNAGIMACPEIRVGPGWEAQFAINHLGHFALVNHLWPAIAEGGARVVSVASLGHRRSGIRWDDPQFNLGYDKWSAYGQAKTANILFAVQLDALAANLGVRAFSLHPGNILTLLQRHLPRQEMVAAGWMNEDGTVNDPSFKTPEQGAATVVWAATSPQLAHRGGLYLEDCEVAAVAETPASTGVQPYALDPDDATRLWELSAELTGVNAF